MRTVLRPHTRWTLVLAAILTSAHPDGISAQVRSPDEGGRTVSLGQPGPWDFHVGARSGVLFTEGEKAQGLTGGHLGVYRDLTGVPLLILGVEGSSYAGSRGTRFDWGFRAQFMSPFFRLGIGADYNGPDGRMDTVLSLVHPVRRGGLFGFGSSLRLDYLPGRDHSFTVGFQLPFGQTMPMGRTRPREDAVRLANPDLDPIPISPPPTALQEALGNLGEAALWMYRLGVPYIEQSGWSEDAPLARAAAELEELKAHIAETGPLYPHGRSFAEEVRVFHAELDRAFSIAITGRLLQPGEWTPEGREASRRAREVLLEEVLLPYDRLLGQIKEEDTILEFGARARGIFVRWLHTQSPVSGSRENLVLWVFTRLLGVMEDTRRFAHDTWDDSRFVWLPLQYALTPDQHDSQAELDALVEQAVERPFTEGNRISYVINEQFDYQLGRMILEAEDYHVLWIHDFPGWNENGLPDAVAYAQVLDSYMTALVEKVRAYDETGRLPVYMIFIDEWFYALRDGHVWMDLLEDPLRHRMNLPGEFQEWEESISRAQEELRRVVAGSQLLQAEAAQYGESWLRDRIKVHVSITNRADPSFWNRQILPLVGIPDGVMRDHRKVSFYDITEEDPYRGRAMYTGMGVGEQYNSPSWEDRAVMLQGPAALGLKSAARDLLLDQGFALEEIPYHLQPRPGRTSPIAPPLTTTPWASDARVLEIHNQTGYSPKLVNVAKAVLYSTMPPGSVIKTPDSLWNSGFWGGMLLGGALRGVRVLIIAPAESNAPSWGFGQMARAKEIFVRLIAAQQILDAEIESQGGLLKTGLFAPESPVTDVRAKLGAFMRTYEEEEFVRELFPLHPSILPVLESVLVELETQGVPLQAEGAPREAAPGEGMIEVPRLHLKANFLASADAWNGLMSRPELGTYFRVWMENRVAQLRNRELALQFPGSTPERMLEAAMPALTEWEQTLLPEEREQLIFFLFLGSANQNYRSMVMDGEVSVLLSGWSSIIAIIDFISITGQSIWVDDLTELDRLLPGDSGWRRRLGQWIRVVL